MDGTTQEFGSGLQSALCALSFFRHRHDSRPRYKKSRRSNVPMVPVNREYVRVAREFISEARRKGFKGSIIEALKIEQQGTL